MTEFDMSRLYSFEAEGLSVLIYPNGGLTLFSFGGEREARFLSEHLSVSLVLINGIDWERDLSPWPAPRAFKSGNDFEGRADELIEKLERTVFPKALTLTGPQTVRGIAGYSLAGLFSLYCLYKTSLFSRVASVSGSLWYDGFSEFMKQHSPVSCAERVYLSVGDREKHARSPRLGCVEDRTRMAESLLRSHGLDVSLEINRGGHFNDPLERLLKGAKFLFSAQDF